MKVESVYANTGDNESSYTYVIYSRCHTSGHVKWQHNLNRGPSEQTWEEIPMFPSECLEGRQIFLKSEICSFKITLFRHASLQNFTSHIHFLDKYYWICSIWGRNEKSEWRAVGTKRFAAGQSSQSVSPLVTQSFKFQGAKSASLWSRLHEVGFRNVGFASILVASEQVHNRRQG